MPVVQVVIDDSTDKTITGVWVFGEGGKLAIPHGTSFPTTPAANELFWRDDEDKLYKRNAENTAWVLVKATIVNHASTHAPGGSDALAVDAAPSIGSLRTLGTGAQQACAGDDPRLSDARLPLAHADSHASSGSDPVTVEQSQVSGLTAALAEKLPLTHVAETTHVHPRVSNVLSTGVLAGGGIRINATNPSAFDVDPTIGIIINNWTNPENPSRIVVNFPGATGVEVENLEGDETYLYLDASGQIVQRSAPVSVAETRELIYLGWVSHLDHQQLDDAYSEPYTVHSPKHTLQDFLEAFGAFNVEGNEYYPADSGLLLRRTAGKTFDSDANFMNDPKSPNILETPAQNPVEMIYYYRDENGEWMNNNSPTMYVDPNHYDTGHGLAEVPTGKWTIQLIMFYAPWQTTDIQYGQVVYDSYAEARAAIWTPVTLNPYNAEWDTFRGWLFVKQGATDLSDPTQAVLVPAGKLGLVSVSSGGGSGGEANTASNVGSAGVGVFHNKAGIDLQFRKLNAASSKLSVVLDVDNKKIDFDVVPEQISHQALFGAGTNTHADIDTHISDTNNPHNTTAAQVGAAPTTRQINTTNGLQGGGDLSANRTISPVYGTTAGTICQGNDPRLSDARPPLAHASTHHVGGSDQLSHQSLSGAGTNTHAAIDSHIANTSNPHSTTKDQVGLGNVTNDAQLKRAAGDFTTFPEKTTPASNDVLLIEDSQAANAKKYVRISNLPGGGGTDPNAIHKNVAAEISTITEKTVLATADLLVIEDSASSYAKRRVTVANLLKTCPRCNRDTYVWFFDDFIGALYDNRRWAVTGTGSVTTMSEIGGVVRVRANSGASYEFHLSACVPFSIANYPRFECRGRLVPPSAGDAEMGLEQNPGSADWICIMRRPSLSANWICECASGGALTQTITTTPANSNTHIFKIEGQSGQVRYYVDDVLLATHTTNIPSGLLKPYAYATGSGGTSDIFIDWIEVVGLRT